MKDLTDLKCALQKASDKQLIEEFCVQSHYLDIDFRVDGDGRSRECIQRILTLRDYIKQNYQDVVAADYMPLLNRLRLYGNFSKIK